jgi:hypothetical protein
MDPYSICSGFERKIHMQVARLCMKFETPFCIYPYSFTVCVESLHGHFKVGGHKFTDQQESRLLSSGM